MLDQAETLRQLMQSNKSKTKIITITSGKGGVGKTNISANLALAYAKLGKKVIIIDADLGLANLNIVLGIIPQYNLTHLLDKKKTLKEVLTDTKYGVQILAGGIGISKMLDLKDKELTYFMKELYTLSYADLIIIDTGAGISNNVLSFVLAADYSIVVTTPEPTALTDAYGLIKIVSNSKSDNKLYLLTNRAKTLKEGKEIADTLINTSRQFLNMDIEYLGSILEDSNIGQSVLKQKPFYHLNPNSKASICLNQIVVNIENIINNKDILDQNDNSIANFIKRLFLKIKE